MRTRILVPFYSLLYSQRHTAQFSHSVMSDSVTPWTAARQASLSITNSQSLLKLMSIESVMPSNYFILCHPLLPPSVFPNIRVLSSESVLLIRWPKYGASASVLPVNIQDWFPLGLTGWLDFLAVQQTQESFPTPQFKSINSLMLSILYRPTLTSIHDYSHIHTKTIALTRRTFLGKVMPLLFNMLSRLVIAFLPGSKCLLISWLQSPSAVILEPKKIKTLFPWFPHLFAWSDGTGCHDISFLNVGF